MCDFGWQPWRVNIIGLTYLYPKLYKTRPRARFTIAGIHPSVSSFQTLSVTWSLSVSFTRSCSGLFFNWISHSLKFLNNIFLGSFFHLHPTFLKTGGILLCIIEVTIWHVITYQNDSSHYFHHYLITVKQELYWRSKWSNLQNRPTQQKISV